MLGKIIDAALSPVRDGLDVIDGLSEGEIREKAIIRLGADVVAGMSISAIVDFLKDD